MLYAGPDSCPRLVAVSFSKIRSWLRPSPPPSPRPAPLAAEKKAKESRGQKSGDLLQVAIVGVGGRGGEHIVRVPRQSQYRDRLHRRRRREDRPDVGPKRWASGRAKRPSSSATSARRWTTSRSTSSPPPRPTTGTPCARSGPCRPARTSTWRSRSATTSAKAAASSKSPASTTASARPARNAAR